MYNAVVPGMPIWPITQERGIQGEKTKPFRERKGFTGVANAARTRDLLNHNQMLYQLSYSHHVLASCRSATGENYTRFSSYVYIGVLRVPVVGLRCGLFIM